MGRGRWKIAPTEAGGGFDTWRAGVSRRVDVEHHVPAAIVDGLRARGHEVAQTHWGSFGHAHLIEVTEHGSFAGVADPRALTGVAAGL